MNHDEKLYNSFRIAKGDILRNKENITQLSMKIIELNEMMMVMKTEHELLYDSVIDIQENRKDSGKDKDDVRYGVENQHVVPRDNNWAVISAKAKRASKLFDTKDEAVKYARDIATKGRACLVVHNKDGTITRKEC